MLRRSLTRTFHTLTLAGLATAWITSAGALAQSQYRVVLVPAPEGASSFSGIGLNNSNEVTGGGLINTQTHPYLYHDGQSQWLDAIEGIQTSGWAISDGGHITGWMYEWGVIWPQAYLWDGEVNHWLIDPDRSYTYAQGLNESDQVVGFYYPPNAHANGDAFVVSNGQYHNLGSGQATDISENGIIVGQDNRYFGATTVWEPDGHGGWSPTFLDGLQATAINDDGTMFCGAGPLLSYFTSPVVWTRQNNQWVRTDIGDWDPQQVNALANDVNNDGQVVGSYQAFDEPDQGWIYENDQVTMLANLLTPDFADWQVTSALRINESGVILANVIPANETLPTPALLIPDQLTMLAPRGDGAGADNELIATSAAPGHRVYFIYGMRTGQQNVPGCPGVSVGVRAPQIIGSAVADSNLEARLNVSIPGAASGRTVYFQAVDRIGCEVSNVLRYTFR